MSKLQVDQVSKTTAGAATFVLPASDGTAGQYMKTDGSGQLGWVTASSGADTSLSNLVAAGADKIIKGWVCFGGAAATIKDSFNVSSITDNGVGSYAVVWDTDFSNANYAVVCGGDASSGGGDYIQCQNTGQVVGSNDVHCYTGGAGSKFDPGYVSIVAIGDQ
jgi:hypothetical protein